MILNMKRPTHKELFNKIKQAISAIDGEGIYLVEPDAIVIDAIQLGYDIETELNSILLELLKTAEPEHYAGTSPPQRSYEDEILDCELFAFKVPSNRFRCDIYVKYALKSSHFYLVSLHEDRIQRSTKNDLPKR